MNIFGIGTMELAVIFLVAIIALGPGKTMETARTLGRIMREARRTFTEVMDAASLNDTNSSRQPDAPSQNADAPVPPPDAPRRPPETPLDTPPHLSQQQDSPENPPKPPNNPDGPAKPAD